MFKDMSSAAFYRGLRPTISLNSKVSLIEKFEGMGGKEKKESMMKVMRNMFKLMVTKTKELLSISSPMCSKLVQMLIFLKCLLHNALTQAKIFKGHLNSSLKNVAYLKCFIIFFKIGRF